MRGRIRSRGRVLAGIAGIAGFSVALSGCAGGPGDDVDAKSNLAVLTEEVSLSIDPDGTDTASPATQELINNLADPLLTYSTVEKGDVLVPDFASTDFTPELAEGWERSEDGLTWTFKLREGVTSCAGNELTSEDVLYTFARAKSVSNATPTGWFIGMVGNLWGLEAISEGATDADKELGSEVVAIDKYTVQFTQTAETDLFPRVLDVYPLHIFDSAAMKEASTDDDPWTQGQFHGFGPYCLDDFKPGESYRLSANENYWKPRPDYTNVFVNKVASESQRIAAISSGQADVVTGLGPKGYAEVEAAGAKVPGWQGLKVLHLGINFAFEPFGPENPLLRQAIAYALPYDDIIDNAYLGQAIKADGLMPSVLNGTIEVEGYQSDTEMAKKLLAEAGFPGGAGLEKYSEALTLYYPSEQSTLLEPVGNAIKTRLAEVGIPISLSPISQSEFLNRENVKRDMPLWLRSTARPLTPDVGYATVLWHVSPANGGLNASSNYDSSTIDNAFKASQASSGEARQEQLDIIQRQLMVDLPLVPIANVSSRIALGSKVSGWLGTSGDTLYFATFTDK